MKKILSFLLIASLLGCSTPEKEVENIFYCFSNAGNLPNAPEGLEANAAFLKNLGYDGWAGHYGEDDYTARRTALDKAGLEMPEIYWNLDIDSAGNWTYKEGLEEVIKDSKDRNLIVSLLVRAQAYQEDQEKGDPLVVKAIQSLADFAAPHGVKIAVYPHVNVYCETLEHSLRLAKMADRDNVGAIFNLCHLLKKEGEEGWEQKLTDAIPHLYMISICGADAGNTKAFDWDQLIQPLGEGSFDCYALIKTALDGGYEGPFGLQCYNIKQDANVAMTTSINTWKEYQHRYQNEVQTIIQTEVQTEFVDLFEGQSSKGWRGINSDHFPEAGWNIENKIITVHANDDAETSSGGDIITMEKFGDFELKWEWLMLSKGGNSGLKYYVEERKQENSTSGIGLEYQILDDMNHEWMLSGKMTPCDYHTLGSLYEIYPASCDKEPKPLGEWNSSKIVSRDGHVEHWLNGKLILSFERFSDDFKQKVSESKFKEYSDFGQITEGHILIQDHGSVVQYRNVLIKTFN